MNAIFGVSDLVNFRRQTRANMHGRSVPWCNSTCTALLPTLVRVELVLVTHTA